LKVRMPSLKPLNMTAAPNLTSAGQALRDCEARYRILFDANPQPMWVCELKTLTFLAVNDAAVRHYGYSRDDFLSMSMDRICPRDDLPRLRQLLERETSIGPCRHIKKDGTVIYAETTLHPLLFGDRPARLMLSVDVTEGKRADFLYRMLVDSIPSSVLLIDESLCVSLANRNFLEKARRSKADTFGKPLTEVFPLVILDELGLLAQIRQAFKSAQASQGQRLTYRAPGVPLRTYYYGIIPMSWGGHVEHVMLLMDDVTEQLRLGEEIRRIERHLASVVESANEIVLSTDTKGRISSWNTAAVRICGYTSREVQGKSLFDYCPECHREKLRASFREAGQQGNSCAAEYDFTTNNGAVIPISWVFSPMKDDAGATVGIVAVGRDLTEQRKFELQIRQADKLAALGVMAGGIAHEVRTPLTIASSAAQFLMEDDITPEFRKECAAKVHLGMHRASAIIENLLRFARPSGHLEMTQVNLETVIRQACTLIANEARLQKIEILFKFPNKPTLVAGIASLLEQVFLNLFFNAMNAISDGGTLTISVEELAGKAAVHVTDTGCGIANKDVDKIFDPFYTNARVGGGTGLGLSICYSIVKQHSGSIDAESVPGKGTTFLVTFPAVPRQ
jgi:PAS domain S-box-containing protein